MIPAMAQTQPPAHEATLRSAIEALRSGSLDPGLFTPQTLGVL